MICKQCTQEYDVLLGLCPFCGLPVNKDPEKSHFLREDYLLKNRYEIKEVVGFGGFGIVYKAWDRSLEAIVAVKEFFPNNLVLRADDGSNVKIYSGEKEFRKGVLRFLTEARSMAQFNTHPNIVNVFDFFEENNTSYIVMEYLDGISLKAYLKALGGTLDIDSSVKIIRKLLLSVDELHKAKIIHRDISPDNIFICEGDTNIKLIDFGAARFVKDEDSEYSVILKPGYAPVEQYHKRSRQGPWTDIYAIGGLLYHLLTGIKPDESVNREIEDILVPPNQINPDISEALNNTILKAMSVEAKLRFQNAKDFIKALDGEKKVKPLKEEIKARKITRIVQIAAAVLVLVIGSIYLYKTYEDKQASLYLKAADLSIWIQEDEQYPGKVEAFKEASKEFLENYKEVKIDFKSFPKKDYAKKLVEAAEKDELPELFESTEINKEQLEKIAKGVEGSLDQIPKNERVLQESYEEAYKDKKQFPLSFQAPLLFTNINLEKKYPVVDSFLNEKEVVGCSIEAHALPNMLNYFFDEDIKSKEELTEKMNTKVKELQAYWAGFSKENAWNYEAFKEKEAIFYVSDTKSYFKVQEDLPGIYRLDFPEKLSIASFNLLFSIAKNTEKDQLMAAQRYLSYLISEKPQDVLFVKSKLGLPLNKKVLDLFMGVNPELTKIEENLGNYKFFGEEQAEIWDICERTLRGSHEEKKDN